MHSDDTVRIPVWAGKDADPTYTIVDAADAEWVSRYRWELSYYGYVKRRIQVGGKRKTHFLHRLILGLAHGDGMEGDHADRDRLNNRRNNLRPLTKGANRQNKSAYRGSTSTYRGVSWDKTRNKWRASVQINGERRYEAYFTTEQEAAEAAKLARQHLMPFATN